LTLRGVSSRWASLALVLALGLQASLGSNTAEGAFPGLNGKIAFTSSDDIYLVNADGSGQARLTDSAASDLGPSFSPNGSRIAFASDRAGPYEIYVMNADGSGETRLTHNSASDAEPAFSPDGRRIA
jgi:Tol biopolymer transport system component